MALAVSVLFVCSLAALAHFSLSYFTREFKTNISRQQYGLVSSLAENIDDKFDIAHRMLQASARKIPRQAITDPDSAQRYLDTRFALLALFDNALFIFSKEGKIIAESPFREGRRGRDISFRDYYKNTIATGKPLISNPYVSTHNPGHPSIMLTVPVFDDSGELVAILAGSFDLLGKNFLQALSSTKVGTNGYLFLCDSNRTMIVHPDKTRIMRQDVPPGANPLFDKALSGFDGSGETVNSRGLRCLSSFRHLKSTAWILGANFPLSEAYEPLLKAGNYLAVVIIVGTAIILSLVWLLMHHLTAPLRTVTRHVESLTEKSGTDRLVTVEWHDEIGTLANAFNTMVTTIDLHQKALRESELNFRALADNANDGMQIIINRSTFAYTNRHAADIVGYSLAEFLELTIMQLVHPDEKEHILERYARAAAGEDIPKKFETVLCRKDGTAVPVEVTSALTVWQDKPAELVIVRDISDRKKAEEEIQQLAYYDTLTALPNRTLLRDRLSQSIAQAHRDTKHVGILFLDLDRFKSVNDTLGHLVGDKLLKSVATRLTACTRESDTVSRLGGDEFVIILSAIAHVEDMTKMAEQILESLSVPIKLDGQEIFTTASIGIAVFPHDSNDRDELLKQADIAMYQAKEQGRNNFQYYSPEMNVQALERLMLETSMRRALERDEFHLLFQPQMEVATGRIIGMEALIRWHHPDLGLLSPAKFIPLAEETGQIVQIGEWVLRKACSVNKGLQDSGCLPLRVAVNISASQFRQQNFVPLVAEVLADTGLHPSFLELEVTESALMSNAAENIAVLRSLKNMQINLAIDDFGTGYSSLSYLKNFPIDRVKIDRSFIRDITSNTEDAAIASAIIAMAHSLNLKVTAEGVEHLKQLEFLAMRNCDEMQGYFLAVPLPESDLAYFLRRDPVITE
jgi:diguanylate cyclase (GGDEF)-like protein/PAS domain S-box-containing protein